MSTFRKVLVLDLKDLITQNVVTAIEEADGETRLLITADCTPEQLAAALPPKTVFQQLIDWAAEDEAP